MAKITRIKATDSKEVEKKVNKAMKPNKEIEAARKTDSTKKVKTVKKEPAKKGFILFRPFKAFFRYIRESWEEIRQVRWPNRKATWKMVLAVLAYTALFVLLITLLDVLFSFIFSNILK